MASQNEKLIAEARRLVEKGQYDKALKAYLRIVSEDEKDVRVWLSLGDLYTKLRRTAEAVQTYERVALYYGEQGHHRKAIAVYKQILKLDPSIVSIKDRLAELYKLMGQIPDAILQYQDVEAHHRARGDMKAALAAMKQWVELDPHDVGARVQLAEAFSKAHMAREAVDEFAKAAEYLHEQQRFDDYMKVAERLLFHTPDNRPVSRELARLYLRKGDARRALPRLQVSFKADPHDAETLTLLADAFESLGQRAKAVSVLKELARVYGDNGRAAERERVQVRILRLEPTDPEARQALERRAAAAAAEPSPAAGIHPERTRPVGPSAAQHAAVAQPGAGQAAQDVGSGSGQLSAADEEQIQKILSETDVFMKYSLHAKAIEHVKGACLRAPNHVGARDKLKNLYLALGRHAEALAELRGLIGQTMGTPQGTVYLQEMLRLVPNDPWATAQLSAAGVSSGAPTDPSGPTQPRESASASPRAAHAASAEETEEIDESDLQELDEGDITEVGEYEDGALPVQSAREAPDIDYVGFDEQNGDTGNDTRSDEAAPITLAEAGTAPAIPPGLEEEFEETDFFLQQGLLDEAREALRGLQARYPDHPLVRERMRELDAQLASAAAAETIVSDTAHNLHAGDRSIVGPIPRKNVVEVGVNDDDFESHFDLGIAYKEMGLLDDAIAEFQLVMRDPTRQVVCHQMLGLCLAAKGMLPEAISHFKQGLYAEGLQENEELSLYYELGCAYEELHDTAEATYYYERISKRVPHYRDVPERLKRITPSPVAVMNDGFSAPANVVNRK